MGSQASEEDSIRHDYAALSADFQQADRFFNEEEFSFCGPKGQFVVMDGYLKIIKKVEFIPDHQA